MQEKDLHEQLEDKIEVLVVEPMKKAYVKTISRDLKSLQQAVGGPIDATYPFEDMVGIVLNGEGKYRGLPLNRGLYNSHGELYDIIAGTFLVVGLSEDDFTSLSKEQIDKFMEKYKIPEIFANIGGKIVAVPAIQKRNKAKSKELLTKGRKRPTMER